MKVLLFARRSEASDGFRRKLKEAVRAILGSKIPGGVQIVRILPDCIDFSTVERAVQKHHPRVIAFSRMPSTRYMMKLRYMFYREILVANYGLTGPKGVHEFLKVTGVVVTTVPAIPTHTIPM